MNRPHTSAPHAIALLCNVPDQRLGWIVVLDTPYDGQTTASTGIVQINNIPADSYRLSVGANVRLMELTP